MRPLKLRKPSAALIVAIVALLVAATGTSYAAAKYVISSSAQVKDGALTAADLSPRARAALKGKQGVRGPAGPQGKPGSAGTVQVIDHRIELTATGLRSVLKTYPLGAGTYMLTTTFKLTGLGAGGGSSYPTVECAISNAVPGSPVTWTTSTVFGGTLNQSFSYVRTLTSTTPTSLFQCQLAGSTGSVTFVARTLVQQIGGFQMIDQT